MSKVDNSLNKVCQKRIEDLRKDILSLRTVFLTLGEETRQLILLTLLEQEPKELRDNEIAQHTYLSRSAVSHHLQILKNAGLLKMRKEGIKNYYSIKKQTMIFLSNERNVLQNRMYYQGETKPSSIKLELIYSFYRRIRVQ